MAANTQDRAVLNGYKLDPDHPENPGEKRNGALAYDEDTEERMRQFRKGDPFGDETNAEVKYRTMTWWQAGIVMIAETIALGILSLPSVLATVGMPAGIVLILGLGIIATYTGYVLGKFKLAYPHVHNMADAGEILFMPLGRVPSVIAREIFGAAQIIFYIMLMGSHVLTWSIAFDTMTGHAVCSIVWSVIGMIVMFLFTLPRTLRKVSYLSFASFISVLSAVLITMIAIGIEAPNPTVQASTTVAFATAFGSVTNIIFAFAGHVAFFSFISELKDPRQYMKALFTLQGADISLYLVAAIVIYRYGGPEVASPSLGSTSPTVQKVAYGIALPTIVIAGIINAHVAAKYIYVRIYRGSEHMHKRTFLAIGSWVGIIFVLWVIAWILAESITVFNNLLGLIAALFASWFTYGLSGVFWLFLNHGQWFAGARKACLTILNVFIFCLGAAICGIGLYSSGLAINESVSEGNPWSC